MIEDNPADFRLLQLALLEVGAFEVKLNGAGTLKAAIGLLESGPFDVALLDLSLPDTGGLDGLTRLQEAAPELLIVVLTGRIDSELAIQALREGAQDYLVKGQVDGQLLVRAMRYAQERKRGTQQLKRSEERFRSLLENALDIIALVDAAGIVTYASPSVERVLGYSPAEMIGRPCGALVHPEDKPRILEALGGAGIATLREMRVLNKDGRWRVLEVIGRSLLDNPSLSGVVLNARDITERREAEEHLRDVSERVRAVVETSPLAIYVLDVEGLVLGWNHAAEIIFGWTEAEVLHRELPSVPAEARSELHHRLEQAWSGERLEPAEARYIRKNGAHVDVNIWTSLLRDQAGGVTGLVCIVADITERRRLEEQFRQAQKMEAIGRLAGGVAHDFNNLLTVITGYSQLAVNRLPPGSPVASDLNEVLQAADRAASLTRQLLTLSRRKVMEPALLDINIVVSDTERMLNRVLGEDIQLVTRLSPSLAKVRADRGQLELVLLNLAINARDAMPGGGQLTIETGNVQLDSNDIPVRPVAGMSGPCVMLAVSDTGVGMDAQVRAHLFEPFFTTKEPGKGTGLGLSTSYGIIRQHGGDIWVYSEPGVGTTFKVYLPFADPPAPVTPAQPVLRAHSPGVETILLVEDDTSVGGIMRKALEAEGYQVLFASEAETALSIASKFPAQIHLLISDMVLQSSHGVDLARQVKQLRPGTCVLFVSGYTGTALPGHPFLEKGVAFLEKPFSLEALGAKVRELLTDGCQPELGTTLPEDRPA